MNLNIAQQPGIIVMGGHVQALGIIRILGKKNIPSLVIDDTTLNISRFSKFCGRFVQSQPENWKITFQNWIENNEYSNWIIFPTHDSHVEFLSLNKSWLTPHFTVSTDQWERVNIFYDKTKSYQMCQELDIPMATTYCLLKQNDLNQIKINFPCIIKPSVMHHFYSRLKKKVLVCNDRDDLIKQFKLASTIIPEEEIIIQSIIQGDSSSQFSVGVLAIEGKIMAQLSACRMRQHPIDFGNATTYAETIEIPEIIDYAKKIMAHTSFTGMCEIEFKRDQFDNQYKFLEVNPRTWKWHAIAEKAEVPFIEMFYQHLTGNTITPCLQFKRASFFHSLTDWPIRLKLWRMGKKYAFRKIEPCQHAVWSWRDPLPWIVEKILLPYLILKR